MSRDLLFPILTVILAVASVLTIILSWRRMQTAEPSMPRTLGIECRVTGCESLATRFGLSIERNEGFLSWWRTRLGAPPRYRIGWAIEGPLAYCKTHCELARAELQSALVRVEQKRLAALRDAEIELSRFELVGLDERLAELIASHELSYRTAYDKPVERERVA